MKNVKKKLIKTEKKEDGISYTSYQPVEIIDRNSVSEEEARIMDEKFNKQWACEIISYKLVQNLHMRFKIKKEVAKGTCTDYSPSVQYGMLWAEREYLLQIKNDITNGSVEAIDEIINKFEELA